MKRTLNDRSTIINTFYHQERLPVLPVPKLEDTMVKFLEWVKPLLSEEQFVCSKKTVDDFTAPSGEGQILQKRLEQFSREVDGSWLKPFWDDIYHTYRGPIAININYVFKLKSDRFKEKCHLVARIVYTLTRVYQMIAENTLSPEMDINTPLCMEQYRYILKASRVPGEKRDEYFTANHRDCKHHIVIFYNEHVFKLNVSDETGKLYSSDKIVQAIEKLMADYSGDKGDNIGIITTGPRDEVAGLYSRLCKSELNKRNLDLIKSAVIAVCIDQEDREMREIIHSLLCSDGKNRFFDKSCQLIIDARGEVGVNLEHTAVDGSTWVNVLSYIDQDLGDREQENDASLPPFKKLEWDIDDDTRSQLASFEESHIKRSEDCYIALLELPEFGREWIKSIGVSPDAYFHVGLQLAQYKVFGTLRSTYESVSIRSFFQGRTECNRPITMELVEFIKAWVEGNKDPHALKTLLASAFTAHSERVKECQRGRGVERHLFGLLKMYEHYGEDLGIKDKPEFFKDPAYEKLCSNFISSSGLGAEYIDYFAFGPVEENGFGVSYSFKRERITVCVSSKKHNSDNAVRLSQGIKEALYTLKDIWLSKEIEKNS